MEMKLVVTNHWIIERNGMFENVVFVTQSNKCS